MIFTYSKLDVNCITCIFMTSIILLRSNRTGKRIFDDYQQRKQKLDEWSTG